MSKPRDKGAAVTKRRTNGKGRTGKQTAILLRTFGDLPVVDATSDLRVSITRADVRRGKAHDPSRCAIAQACIRELGSSAAVVYKTRAYVDVLGEDGVRRVERFRLSPASRAVVEAFDRGQKVPTDGRWLVLSAPAPGQTLDADLRYQRKRRRAIKRGTYKPATVKAHGTPSPRSEGQDLPVRSGTGHWQMIQAREAVAA